MFYSQDFAPNENFRSYAKIPNIILGLFRTTPDLIPKLESSIAHAFFGSGTLDCTLFFSGRSALYHLLTSLVLPKGSSVIVQSFTCTAVVSPVIHAGLHPVYVDICEDDFSADFDDLKSKVTSDTKVIILQHTFGIIPKCRQQVIDLCRAKNIFLIEDAAHGLDPSTYKAPRDFDKYAVLLSFGRSKLVSSVFGACIATPKGAPLGSIIKQAQKSLPKASPSLVARCIAYKYLTPLIKAAYTMNKIVGKSIHKLIGILKLFPKEITKREKNGEFAKSFDCKYPDILAHILQGELLGLGQIIKTSRKLSKYWSDSLGTVNKNPLVRYPYLCSSAAQKSKILAELRSKNISLGTWYGSPVAPPDNNQTALGYIPGSCPKCEDINGRIINLPLNIDLNLAEIILKEVKTTSKLTITQ